MVRSKREEEVAANEVAGEQLGRCTPTKSALFAILVQHDTTIFVPSICAHEVVKLNHSLDVRFGSMYLNYSFSEIDSGQTKFERKWLRKCVDDNGQGGKRGREAVYVCDLLQMSMDRIALLMMIRCLARVNSRSQSSDSKDWTALNFDCACAAASPS